MAKQLALRYPEEHEPHVIFECPYCGTAQRFPWVRMSEGSDSCFTGNCNDCSNLVYLSFYVFTSRIQKIHPETDYAVMMNPETEEGHTNRIAKVRRRQGY